MDCFRLNEDFKFEKDILYMLGKVFKLDFLVTYKIMSFYDIKNFNNINFLSYKKNKVDKYLFIENYLENTFLDLSDYIKNRRAIRIINVNELDDNYIKQKLIQFDIGKIILCEIIENKGPIGLAVGGISNRNDLPLSDEYIYKFKFLFEGAFYILNDKGINYHLNKIGNFNLNNELAHYALRISHDLNNTLTPALGVVENINNECISEKLKENIDILSLCINDAINILNNVPINKDSFNKQKELINIDNLITESISIVKNKWGNNNNICIEKNLNSNVIVYGNSTELREVLVNMIKNSIEAMPNGGCIQVKSNVRDENVVILIKDFGVGINKEHLEKVFNPFFSTKGYMGSGVGLSICKEIISNHGGNILVNSEMRKGTSFFIQLPIYKNQDLKDEFFNILIIDDNKEIRFVVSSLVEKIFKGNIKVCGPEKWEEEIEKDSCDIVISDFIMNDIDGFQLCKNIRQKNKSIYFCIMTGFLGNIKNQYKDKVNYILKKPINLKQLEMMKVDYLNFKSSLNK